jgi:hypothetical protein
MKWSCTADLDAILMVNNPMNVVIVTSAIGTKFGAIPISDRFSQTVVGLKSIKEKMPNSYVIFSDCSLEPIIGDTEEIRELVDQYFDYSKENSHNSIKYFSSQGMKSHGELFMVRECIEFCKSNLNMNSVDRIFKIGGRGILTDNFDLSKYDAAVGKYVFKTPVNSWIGEGVKLYETRMYSMHRDNISDYLSRWLSVFESCHGDFQIEHSYYKCLDHNMVCPFDTLGLEYVVSLFGQTAND